MMRPKLQGKGGSQLLLLKSQLPLLSNSCTNAIMPVFVATKVENS